MIVSGIALVLSLSEPELTLLRASGALEAFRLLTSAPDKPTILTVEPPIVCKLGSLAVVLVMLEDEPGREPVLP